MSLLPDRDAPSTSKECHTEMTQDYVSSIISRDTHKRTLRGPDDPAKQTFRYSVLKDIHNDGTDERTTIIDESVQQVEKTVKMRALLTCRVCKKIMDKVTCLPVCMHRACLDCIVNLFRDGRPFCPVCGQFMLPSMGLHREERVDNIIRQLGLDKEREKGVVIRKESFEFNVDEPSTSRYMSAVEHRKAVSRESRIASLTRMKKQLSIQRRCQRDEKLRNYTEDDKLSWLNVFHPVGYQNKSVETLTPEGKNVLKEVALFKELCKSQKSRDPDLRLPVKKVEATNNGNSLVVQFRIQENKNAPAFIHTLTYPIHGAKIAQVVPSLLETVEEIKKESECIPEVGRGSGHSSSDQLRQPQTRPTLTLTADHPSTSKMQTEKVEEDDDIVMETEVEAALRKPFVPEEGPSKPKTVLEILKAANVPLPVMRKDQRCKLKGIPVAIYPDLKPSNSILPRCVFRPVHLTLTENTKIGHLRKYLLRKILQENGVTEKEDQIDVFIMPLHHCIHSTRIHILSKSTKLARKRSLENVIMQRRAEVGEGFRAFLARIIKRKRNRRIMRQLKWFANKDRVERGRNSRRKRPRVVASHRRRKERLRRLTAWQKIIYAMMKILSTRRKYDLERRKNVARNMKLILEKIRGKNKPEKMNGGSNEIKKANVTLAEIATVNGKKIMHDTSQEAMNGQSSNITKDTKTPVNINEIKKNNGGAHNSTKKSVDTEESNSTSSAKSRLASIIENMKNQPEGGKKKAVMELLRTALNKRRLGTTNGRTETVDTTNASDAAKESITIEKEVSSEGTNRKMMRANRKLLWKPVEETTTVIEQKVEKVIVQRQRQWTRAEKRLKAKQPEEFEKMVESRRKHHELWKDVHEKTMKLYEEKWRKVKSERNENKRISSPRKGIKWRMWRDQKKMKIQSGKIMKRKIIRRIGMVGRMNKKKVKDPKEQMEKEVMANGETPMQISQRGSEKEKTTLDMAQEELRTAREMLQKFEAEMPVPPVHPRRVKKKLSVQSDIVGWQAMPGTSIIKSPPQTPLVMKNVTWGPLAAPATQIEQSSQGQPICLEDQNSSSSTCSDRQATPQFQLLPRLVATPVNARVFPVSFPQGNPFPNDKKMSLSQKERRERRQKELMKKAGQCAPEENPRNKIVRPIAVVNHSQYLEMRKQIRHAGNMKPIVPRGGAPVVSKTGQIEGEEKNEAENGVTTREDVKMESSVNGGRQSTQRTEENRKHEDENTNKKKRRKIWDIKIPAHFTESMKRNRLKRMKKRVNRRIASKGKKFVRARGRAIATIVETVRKTSKTGEVSTEKRRIKREIMTMPKKWPRNVFTFKLKKKTKPFDASIIPTEGNCKFYLLEKPRKYLSDDTSIAEIQKSVRKGTFAALAYVVCDREYSREQGLHCLSVDDVMKHRKPEPLDASVKEYMDMLCKRKDENKLSHLVGEVLDREEKRLDELLPVVDYCNQRIKQLDVPSADGDSCNTRIRLLRSLQKDTERPIRTVGNQITPPKVPQGIKFRRLESNILLQLLGRKEMDNLMKRSAQVKCAELNDEKVQMARDLVNEEVKNEGMKDENEINERLKVLVNRQRLLKTRMSLLPQRIQEEEIDVNGEGPSVSQAPPALPPAPCLMHSSIPPSSLIEYLPQQFKLINGSYAMPIQQPTTSRNDAAEDEFIWSEELSKQIRGVKSKGRPTNVQKMIISTDANGHRDLKDESAEISRDSTEVSRGATTSAVDRSETQEEMETDGNGADESSASSSLQMNEGYSSPSVEDDSDTPFGWYLKEEQMTVPETATEGQSVQRSQSFLVVRRGRDRPAHPLEGLNEDTRTEIEQFRLNTADKYKRPTSPPREPRPHAPLPAPGPPTELEEDFKRVHREFALKRAEEMRRKHPARTPPPSTSTAAICRRSFPIDPKTGIVRTVVTPEEGQGVTSDEDCVRNESQNESEEVPAAKYKKGQNGQRVTVDITQAESNQESPETTAVSFPSKDFILITSDNTANTSPANGPTPRLLKEKCLETVVSPQKFGQSSSQGKSSSIPSPYWTPPKGISTEEISNQIDDSRVSSSSTSTASPLVSTVRTVTGAQGNAATEEMKKEKEEMVANQEILNSEKNQPYSSPPCSNAVEKNGDSVMEETEEPVEGDSPSNFPQSSPPRLVIADSTEEDLDEEDDLPPFLQMEQPPSSSSTTELHDSAAIPTSSPYSPDPQDITAPVLCSIIPTIENEQDSIIESYPHASSPSQGSITSLLNSIISTIETEQYSSIIPSSSPAQDSVTSFLNSIISTIEAEQDSPTDPSYYIYTTSPSSSPSSSQETIAAVVDSIISSIETE